MEIELPDGTVLDAPDDADPSVVARNYMRASGMLSASPTVPSNAMPTPSPVTPDTILPASTRVSAPPAETDADYMARVRESDALGVAIPRNLTPEEQRVRVETIKSLPRQFQASSAGTVAGLKALWALQGAKAQDETDEQMLARWRESDALGVPISAPQGPLRLTPQRIEDVNRELGVMREVSADLESMQLPGQGMFERALGTVTQSLPQTLAGLAVGVGTRNPALAAAAMDPMTGGRSFLEFANTYEDQAVGPRTDPELAHDWDRALFHGGIQGKIEAGTELLPFAKLLEPYLPFLKRTPELLSQEIPGEVVATLGQAIDSAIARGEEGEGLANARAGLAEGITQIPDTLAAALLQGVGHSAIAQGIDTATRPQPSTGSFTPQDLTAAQMDAVLGRTQSGAPLAPSAPMTSPLSPNTMAPPPPASTGSPALAVPAASPGLQDSSAAGPAAASAGAPATPPIQPTAEAPIQEAPPVAPAPTVPPSPPVPAAEAPVSTTDAGTTTGGATSQPPPPFQQSLELAKARAPTPVTAPAAPASQMRVSKPETAVEAASIGVQPAPSTAPGSIRDSRIKNAPTPQPSAAAPTVQPSAPVAPAPTVDAMVADDESASEGYGVEEGDISDDEIQRLFAQQQPGTKPAAKSSAAPVVGRTAAGTPPATDWREATAIRSEATPGGERVPRRVFRGGEREVTDRHFASEALGSKTGRPTAGFGVYFTTEESDAAEYGPTRASHLDIRKPKRFDGAAVPEFNSVDEATAFARELQAQGYDGIVIDNSAYGDGESKYGDWIIPFRPDQVIYDADETTAQPQSPPTEPTPEEPNEIDLTEEFEQDDGGGFDIDAMRAEPAEESDALRRRERPKSKPGRALPYTLRKGEVRAATDEIWTFAGLNPDEMETLPPPQRWAKAKQITMKRFGFKDVVRDKNLQWGEAIDQLKDAFIGLTNMAAVMNVSPLVIGMNGELTLNQHRRSKDAPGALAYYMPVYGNQQIGMTRRNDAFAHEWGHALDWNMVFNYAPELVQDQPKGRGLTGKLRLGGEPKSMDALVRQSWANVLNAMYFDKAQSAAYVLDLQGKIAKTKSAKVKAKLQQQLDNFTKGASKARDMDSAYYSEAKSIDKGAFEPGSGRDYWQRPTEMFARAFEAYIANKIGGLPARHPFVTQSDEMYSQNRVFDFAKAYPEAGDRAAIFAAMDDLMLALRDRVLSTVGAPAEIQPSDVPYWNKQAPLVPSAQLASARGIAAQMKRDLAARKEENARDRAADRRRSAQDQKIRDVHLNKANLAGKRRWLANQGFRAIDKVNELARGLAHTIRGEILSLVDRHRGNQGLRQLKEWFATDPGSGQYSGQKYEESVRSEERRLQNRFGNIVNNHQLNGYSTDKLRTLRDLLVNAVDGRNVAPDVVAAAADLRRYLNDLYAYNQSHGVEIGYARNGYLPRVPDVLAIEEDLQGFREKATELYSQVYDTEIGTTEQLLKDAKRLRSLLLYVTEIARTGNLAKNRALAAAAKPIAKDLKSKLREISKLLKNGEEVPDELRDEVIALTDQLREAMREPWASEAANDWEMRIRGMGPVRQFQFEARGPAGMYSKSRRLPEQADAIMGEYLVNDPLTLISTYTSQTVRRVQFGRFFGNPTKHKSLGWKLNDAMTAARQEYTAADGSRQRVSEDELEALGKSIDLMTGNYQTSLTKASLRWKSKINAVLTPVMLARSLWSQLAEPVTVGIRSGNLMDGLRTYAHQMQDLAARLGLDSAQQQAAWRREMATYFGVVTDHLTDELMQSRYNLLHQSPKDSKALARFFNVIGVHPHAMSMRRSASSIFLTRYAPQMAKRALGTGPQAKAAMAALAELGIPARIEAYQELADLPGKSTAEMEQLTYLPAIRTAINRFVDEAIADPKVVDKPRLATQPEWSFMYGIMSFQFAFQRNVLIASAKRIRTAWDADPKIAAATAASVGAGIATLAAVQFAAWVARLALFSGDDWEEKKEKISEEWLWQSMTRAGLFGAADPIINAWMGLKYQRDLSGLIAGPLPSLALQTAQSVAGAFNDTNSPNTPTAEFRASEAIWTNVIGAYANTLALKIAGANPYIDAALGVGLPFLTSKRVSGGVAETVVESVTGQEVETASEKRAAAERNPTAEIDQAMRDRMKPINKQIREKIREATER